MKRRVQTVGLLCLLLWRACCAARCEDAGVFFESPAVRRFSIMISPGAAASLRANPRTNVPVILLPDGGPAVSALAHLKGSTGSFRGLDDKPGLTLSLPEAGTGMFQGVAKLHLNNSVEDPSFLSEVIGLELFREIGIPSPRTSHAVVTLNGRRLGLYVVVEGFSESCLTRLFHSHGALLEPAPQSDLDGLMLWKAGDKRLNDGFLSAQKLLSAALLRPDPSTRWGALSVVMDSAQTTRFLAMEVALGHRDGYAMARNNYRVHWNADLGKIYLLPHGMDQLFARADYSWNPEMSGLVARAMMASPEGKRLFRQAVSDIVGDPERLSRMTNRVAELMARLAPSVDSNESKLLKESAVDLQTRMTARWRFLKLQLESSPDAPETFVDGVAVVGGWQPVRDTSEGELIQNSDGSHMIRAQGRTSASWRATVLLEKGRYRFEGNARFAAVEPLDVGRNQGVGLRVSGRTATYSEIGGSSSKSLSVDFEVGPDAEEVVLICELRAKAGVVYFEGPSLRLRRLDVGNAAAN